MQNISSRILFVIKTLNHNTFYLLTFEMHTLYRIIHHPSINNEENVETFRFKYNII